MAGVILRTPVMIAVTIGLLRHSAFAVQPPVSQFDQQDYDAATASPAWAEPPSNHHRLYLDVYNVTDFFDSETGGAAGFTDQTLLADTIRPTATVLWDDRFRIQLGLIAEKKYGNNVGFQPVNPWIQMLWQPVPSLSVVLGDLDTPHYFLPALFYPNNYFIKNPDENGMQLILKRPSMYDDFYYNYRLLDTQSHNEKFDLGFVHKSIWKVFTFSYQEHWTHEGGELNPHPINTINDVAQTGSAGIQFHPLTSLIVGADYNYLHSHERQDATDPALSFTSNGDGNLYQAYLRWSRLKVIYGHWRGHHFYHEDGDPMFQLGNLNLATIRWDILLSQDFNLYAESTGYFLGDNDSKYDHDLKASFHIQAAWQFSVPLLEWNSPSASPEGQPVPSRWDYGI